MESVYVRPKEAAAQLRVSVSTVYRRVRKGLLTCKLDQGWITVQVLSNHPAKPPDQPTAPAPQEPKPVNDAPASSGGQRELVILPREGTRRAFFQVLNWR
jgi:hypothetical protein